MGINSGLLAIVGLWQKLNYIPSDNLLEILGIWDTPENLAIFFQHLPIKIIGHVSFF